MSKAIIDDLSENEALTPQDKAYAQKALFLVMCSGEWFTVRQLSRLAKVSDPRANIRTMIERGYRFQKKWDTNDRGIRYKWYRLDMEQTQKNLDTNKNNTETNQLSIFQ